VNHFQGRVSCPYGQSQATADDCVAGQNAACADPNSAQYKTSCRKPGEDGVDIADRINIEVPGQLKERQADDAVYCSCRCDGPDAAARYCECPDGFSCENLVEDIGLGKGQLAGSYCVKDGTNFNPGKALGQPCNNDPAKGALVDCGSEGSNPPLL
jgi:hypothetical protein